MPQGNCRIEIRNSSIKKMTKIVEKLLTEDVSLKQDLNRRFRKIGLGLVLIMIIVFSLFFFGLCRYKKIYKVIQLERELLKLERDSLRFEKELFYRLQDTTQPYVRPIYDTIKLK